MWFGLIFGRLAILRKIVLADYEQLLRTVFSRFQVQKKIKNVFENVTYIISIWEKKILTPKTWKNLPQIVPNSRSIVYCSIGTSLRDFYIMTLIVIVKDAYPRLLFLYSLTCTIKSGLTSEKFMGNWPMTSPIQSPKLGKAQSNLLRGIDSKTVTK